MSVFTAGAVRRTTWLLLGAAIGLAAVLLALSFAAVVGPAVPVPGPVVTVVCVLLIGLIGLVPGVRELEVESARSMLGVQNDLVVPLQPGWPDRGRTVGWVALHLAGGLSAGVLLCGVIPGGVLTIVSAVTGSDLDIAGVTVAVAPALQVAASVLAALVALALTAALGLLARRLAPTVLGPTARDRLAVAAARLAAESEYTRLARDLHDGIGHALTIISVQATATRRAHQAPPGVEAALEVIEATAREALAQLDTLLGMLRDEPSARAPEPDLQQLGGLLDRYRDAGMPVTAHLADPAEVSVLPALASTTAYRIVAEGLANAQRHGGPGAVHVTIAYAAGELTIGVSSPLGRPRSGGRRGRGLDGIRERVRLFGGNSDAGPDGAGNWRLHAGFPTGEQR